MFCCLICGGGGGFKWGCLFIRGWASFLGSGRLELHGHFLGVREVLYYLATPCVIQVHLPVHLPCYDLPPLYPFGFIWCVYVGFGESDGRCVRA